MATTCSFIGGRHCWLGFGATTIFKSTSNLAPFNQYDNVSINEPRSLSPQLPSPLSPPITLLSFVWVNHVLSSLVYFTCLFLPLRVKSCLYTPNDTRDNLWLKSKISKKLAVKYDYVFLTSNSWIYYNINRYLLVNIYMSVFQYLSKLLKWPYLGFTQPVATPRHQVN